MERSYNILHVIIHKIVLLFTHFNSILWHLKIVMNYMNVVQWQKKLKKLSNVLLQKNWLSMQFFLEWITFHEWHIIIDDILGWTLIHCKIPWIFMDFHSIKMVLNPHYSSKWIKNTWNLNSKPFNVLSICSKINLSSIVI